MKTMSLLSFIVLFSVILVCQGRGKYRGFIPNGFNVPNPCTADPTDIWARVGHVNQDWKVDKKAGTYEKTAFGQDFWLALNQSLADNTGDDGVWAKLCPKDSDGDGMTNGVELGDKGCLWRKSNNDKSFDKLPNQLFHPGIPEQADGTLTAENRAKFCSK